MQTQESEMTHIPQQGPGKDSYLWVMGEDPGF